MLVQAKITFASRVNFVTEELKRPIVVVGNRVIDTAGVIMSE